MLPSTFKTEPTLAGATKTRVMEDSPHGRRARYCPQASHRSCRASFSLLSGAFSFVFYRAEQGAKTAQFQPFEESHEKGISEASDMRPPKDNQFFGGLLLFFGNLLFVENR